MFQAIHEDVPIDPALGYPTGTQVRIRVNPTKGQWERWNAARTPAEGETAEQKRAREDETIALLCEFYGLTRLDGFDFATPEAARATWDNPDLPDELWVFLISLPWEIVTARRQALLKNAERSSPPPAFTPASPTTTP